MRHIWTGKLAGKLTPLAAAALPILVAAAPAGRDRLTIRTPSSLRREVCR